MAKQKRSPRIVLFAIGTIVFPTLLTFGVINTFDYYGFNPIYLAIAGGLGVMGLIVTGSIYTLNSISKKK